MNADQLRREFLPRFKTLAATRIARVRAVAEAPTAAACEEVARELHALAGEAGLLGLGAVLGAARQAELFAAELAQSPADASLRERLLRALDELDAKSREEGTPPEPSPRDKFRASFIATAAQRRGRIDRTREGTDDWFTVAYTELRVLGGEAAMLAMTEIVALCTDGVEAARRRDKSALVGALEQLEVALFAEEVPRGAP